MSFPTSSRSPSPADLAARYGTYRGPERIDQADIEHQYPLAMHLARQLGLDTAKELGEWIATPGEATVSGLAWRALVWRPARAPGA